MKEKRIWAWLFLSVYLLTVAAPAAFALTCPYLHRHGETAVSACTLCSGDCSGSCTCEHQHLKPVDGCGHDHSLQVELYTSDRGEARESLRAWILLLAAALPAERLSLPAFESSWEHVVFAPDHCCCACCSAPKALRAPPVHA